MTIIVARTDGLNGIRWPFDNRPGELVWDEMGSGGVRMPFGLEKMSGVPLLGSGRSGSSCLHNRVDS